MSRKSPLSLAAALVLIAAPVLAQEAHGGHGAHGSATSPSTVAFEKAGETMHKDMAIDYSGNADVDFVRGMIPHHQGAIDMAKVVLDHGKDPDIRKLAEEVIRAQEGEIAFMKEWLRKHGQ